MKIEARMKELGVELPPVTKPVAAYVPAVIVDRTVYTAGQIPMVEGKLAVRGKVGSDVTLEEAQEAAGICVLNALAAVKDLIGNLDRVEQVVKMTGFVQSADGFTDQGKILNRASEVLEQVFGEPGKHARCALGANTLPLNATVELDLIVAVR